VVTEGGRRITSTSVEIESVRTAQIVGLRFEDQAGFAFLEIRRGLFAAMKRMPARAVSSAGR